MNIYKNQIPVMILFGAIPEVRENSLLLKIVNSLKHHDFSDLYNSGSYNDIILEGCRVITKAFTKRLHSDTEKSHIIPLSGGLDSRLVLSNLIAFVDKKNIHTVTYGAPGTLDYELGKDVSKALGIQNTSFDSSSMDFDINKSKWTTEHCIKYVLKMGDSLKEYFDTTHIVNEVLGFTKENIYWTGFLGGSLAGSKLNRREIDSWQKTVQEFITHNFLDKTYSPLTKHGDSFLPESPLCSNEILSYQDQFNFAFRQDLLIRKGRFQDGYDWRCLFLDDELIAFFLQAPYSLRVNRKLYKDILIQMFPKEFSFPTKTEYGAPLRCSTYKNLYKLTYTVTNRFRKIQGRLHLGTNQHDIGTSIRKKNDLRCVLKENIQSLSSRNLISWVNPVRLFEEHISGNTSHETMLMSLFWFEIRLKAGVITIDNSDKYQE